MADTDTQFIHLRVHTAYSLAESAIPAKKAIKLAASNGMPAVAMTDSNNMFGAMEFCLAGKAEGVQPIIGTQVQLSMSNETCAEPFKVVLLAMTEPGYRNLCALTSDAYMNLDNDYQPQITFKDLTNHADDIICLSGGADGPIVPLLANGQIDHARDGLKQFYDLFGDRFYIEVQRHGLPYERNSEDALIDLAYELNIPIVATNDAMFPTRDMHEAHDALLCIAEGRYVSEQDRRTATPEHYFKSQQEMIELFSDLPEAISNTSVIAKRCSWFIEPIAPILPPFDCEDGRTEAEELAAQSKKGLEWRFEKYVLPALEKGADVDSLRKEYFDRLDFELNVITQMGFPGYFLIVADFIQWAKDHNIPVGPGRGSGAASIVAWALKITDLDPIDLELLFERFLNPERVSMPDFDIDFCQDRRDEVIKYVQDKYGYDRVAQIITFGKLQARAVVRDVGRVLQMSYGQVDRIAKLIPSNPANPVSLSEALETEEDLRAQRDSDPGVSRLIKIALQLEGLYRHASTHAAGVVIGDRPLHELIPVYRDPRSPMPVTQFNMKYVEEAGLVKFDFLGLKTLTVLQKSVEIVKQEYDEDIDLLALPMKNKTTFDMLAKGDNTGVFQLESAGMRDVGKQMRLEQFEEIIALVALYRPGPMDNIPQYISNKHGTTDCDYMHELLKPILEETYGIMIYQEQVMQAAQILSGYTLGGADLLRRAMGKKIQAEMDKQREIFMVGAGEHNAVPNEQSSHIFDQIAKFAGYGFNKAHAACYAFIAYQTAYMKANYPVEFMTAIMTLDLGNTDKLNIFAQELGRLDITLLGPDINKSMPEFSVEHMDDDPNERGKGVRYALAAIKGVGAAAMKQLVDEREENGPYKDVFDLASRLDGKVMNKKQMENLIKAGAFDAMNPNRAQLFKSVETLTAYSSSLNQDRESGQESLFGGAVAVTPEHLPKLSDAQPWDILERLQHEFAAVGFYLSAHPLDGETEKLERQGVTPYIDIMNGTVKSGRVKMAGVMLKKQERVSAKGNRFAFVQISDATGVYEPLVFSDTLASSRHLLIPGQTLLVTVDLQTLEGEDTPRMNAQGFKPLDEVLEKMTHNVSIILNDTKLITHIEEIVTESGEGGIDVDILVPANDFDHYAHIKIEGRYDIKPSVVRSLRANPSVMDVIES